LPRFISTTLWTLHSMLPPCLCSGFLLSGLHAASFSHSFVPETSYFLLTELLRTARPPPPPLPTGLPLFLFTILIAAFFFSLLQQPFCRICPLFESCATFCSSFRARSTESFFSNRSPFFRLTPVCGTPNVPHYSTSLLSPLPPLYF